MNFIRNEPQSKPSEKNLCEPRSIKGHINEEKRAEAVEVLASQREHRSMIQKMSRDGGDWIAKPILEQEKQDLGNKCKL
ncbi:hypothetical protein Ciccas_001872 [Cichlidogyrus casuarinus]|uniref:Uncharacterized protein n=1 Tax=Cichlidogyrus casuarinus TaxID=1844966 RepID=A0ABD2QJV9_9PLAT